MLGMWNWSRLYWANTAAGFSLTSDCTAPSLPSPEGPVRTPIAGCADCSFGPLAPRPLSAPCCIAADPTQTSAARPACTRAPATEPGPPGPFSNSPPAASLSPVHVSTMRRSQLGSVAGVHCLLVVLTMHVRPVVHGLVTCIDCLDVSCLCVRIVSCRNPGGILCLDQLHKGGIFLLTRRNPCSLLSLDLQFLLMQHLLVLTHLLPCLCLVCAHCLILPLGFERLGTQLGLSTFFFGHSPFFIYHRLCVGKPGVYALSASLRSVFWCLEVILVCLTGAFALQFHPCHVPHQLGLVHLPFFQDRFVEGWCCNVLPHNSLASGCLRMNKVIQIVVHFLPILGGHRSELLLC